MNKSFLILILSLLTFLGNDTNAQEKDKLRIEIRCYDNFYKRDTVGNRMPSFILGIRNESVFRVTVKTPLIFGQFNDHRADSIDGIFELFRIVGTDTVNAVTGLMSRGWRPFTYTLVKLEGTEAFFFEFKGLYPFYFEESGRYKIRFTLFKEYALEYMTKDVSSEWIYFDVEVIKRQKKTN